MLKRTAATPYKVARVPDDAVASLTLVLRVWLTALVEAMTGAAWHRAEAQMGRVPELYAHDALMWGVAVQRDVGKQIAALEKAEREAELRARKGRKERARSSPPRTLPPRDPGRRGCSFLQRWGCRCGR